jgi:hypothetical protein
LSFAKTQSALKTLMFLSQDGSPLLSNCVSQIGFQESRRICPRKPSTATTGCPSGSNSSPPAPAKNGLAVLDLTLPKVEELAEIVDHPKAGYSGSIASNGICFILAAPVETKAHRSPGNRGGNQGFNPEDCRSESALEKSTRTRGSAETRHSYLRADCRPAHAEEEEATITALAGVPE